jgi:hypothetical protein
MPKMSINESSERFIISGKLKTFYVRTFSMSSDVTGGYCGMENDFYDILRKVF